MVDLHIRPYGSTYPFQTPQKGAMGVTPAKFESLNANTNMKAILSVNMPLAR